MSKTKRYQVYRYIAGHPISDAIRRKIEEVKRVLRENPPHPGLRVRLPANAGCKHCGTMGGWIRISLDQGDLINVCDECSEPGITIVDNRSPEFIKFNISVSSAGAEKEKLDAEDDS